MVSGERPTIKTAFRFAVSHLREAGVATPELDARVLLRQATGIERESFSTISEEAISDAAMKKFTTMVQRRGAREPVSRIIGSREFWGLDFLLSSATLDPRPDSETVVEAVLALCDRNSFVRIIDLGTGSGCLLLSVLHELKNATGIGVDISKEAVLTATENAKRLGLLDRAKFIVGNWIDGIDGKFDLVISNPPYIPHADIANLEPEVVKFDPLTALDGGDDGLSAYRIIAAGLTKILKPGGRAVLEVGYGQAKAVADIFQSAGLKPLGARKDLGGVERVVVCENLP